MKELVFLPDREGRDGLNEQPGFVRVGADGAALQALADRLVLPPKENPVRDDAMWRGVLALALLSDAWPDSEVSIAARRVDRETSRFAAWVLAARKEGDALHLVLAEKGEKRILLGVADARCGLTLPANPADFTGFIPARCAWYDAETGRWRNPVPFLNEQERAILLARLTMMGLDAPEITALKTDLVNADKPAVEAVQAGDEEALNALGVRIQAVCALRDFDAFSIRREPCEVKADNAFVRIFSGVDLRYENARECATYLWAGRPFARTGAALGLTDACAPDQAETLDMIEAELQLLGENSPAWSNRCAMGAAEWLRNQDDALLPEARAQAEAIRHVQTSKALQVRQTVTLEWPWDISSGAVKYLLKENLGEGWMAGAANPFSDCLTKLTGHVLGDETLRQNCTCADGVLLPPISREMAKCVANGRDGEGLAADMMRFEPREDGGITASFLLRGAGEIRMVRTYQAEEIRVLAPEESPTAAVWPCLPLIHWRAYHVFIRGGMAVSALCGGEWQTLPANGEWSCLRTDTYPACLCVMEEEKCLGVLPNAQPLRRIQAAGDAQVSIDMGSSATATVITLDGKPIAPQRQELTRLLVFPQDMPEDDFLLSLDPAELTPSTVKLTGEGDELFTDGYACSAARLELLRDMAPGTLCTNLKWRADARSVRARRILLHQVMLGASLNAMLAGAESIRWRVTVADEMADTGRNALLNLVDELSITVAQETGLLLRDGKFTVVWAEEAAAIHAYLKGAGGIKGSFAVLDMGGSSVKLHLWMQGKNRPLGGAVVMEGATTSLLKLLRERPDMLYADFADCGDEAFLAQVEMVCGQLTHAGESAAENDKALLMLDALLEENKQAVTRQMYARFNAQRPMYTQAFLLELYASALFCVGLVLEQSGEDANINHLFPADLPVCLTGRGAWLLDTLTPQLRNGLQRIAHEPVNLRHPVRTVTIRPAGMSAMGVAQGMAVLKETQRTIDTPVIRTRQSFSELMRQMMAMMFQCFPHHVWALHPGLFDGWGNMTPAGEETLRRAASEVYGDGEDIPASAMAFPGKLARMPVMMEAPVYPGE